MKHIFSSSMGEVEEVHFPIRDRVLMPYPTFLTSARFEPGMSGGPVFGTGKDNVGKVVGVITRGMGQPLDAVKFTEWAILAGVLLTIEVEYVENGKPRKCFLADLPTWARPYFDETLQDIEITKFGNLTIFEYGARRVLRVQGTWDV